MPTPPKTEPKPALSAKRAAPAHSPTAPVQSAPLPEFMAETMRLADFAKRYGISLPTAYDWIDPVHTVNQPTPQHPERTPLPSMKIGRERLVHLPTADAWVKARLTGSPSADPASSASPPSAPATREVAR